MNLYDEIIVATVGALGEWFDWVEMTCLHSTLYFFQVTGLLEMDIPFQYQLESNGPISTELQEAVSILVEEYFLEEIVLEGELAYRLSGEMFYNLLDTDVKSVVERETKNWVELLPAIEKREFILYTSVLYSIKKYEEQGGEKFNNFTDMGGDLSDNDFNVKEVEEMIVKVSSIVDMSN